MRFLLVSVVLAALALATSAFMTGPALPTVGARSATSAISSLQMIRHALKDPKLGKPADQRKALLRGLTTEVIRHGRITTTLIRAKAVRAEVNSARDRLRG